MKETFLIFEIIINIITFALFGLDKKRAERKKWRISEKLLFLFSSLGGSIGALFAMKYFHHKTKKPLFYIGIPVILIVQLIVISWVL